MSAAVHYGMKRNFKTEKLEPLYQVDGVQDADHPEAKMNTYQVLKALDTHNDHSITPLYRQIKRQS